MESVVFDVVTKSALVLAVIVAFAVWANAGYPIYVPKINRGR
mgnify:CR=1 FL=1